VLIRSIFLNTKVSQGSVAARLRCVGIFNGPTHFTITAESDGDRILKIVQHLLKLWERIVSCFFTHTRIVVALPPMSLARLRNNLYCVEWDVKL